ncbi:MAG: GldG family protein, partial [Bacteroidales bacterium]|nr:GldG family protein [Bacteroidales bacterium]
MIKSKQTILYTFLLVVGVLTLFNVLSNRFFFRLDLTEDNRFTLSNATKDILNELLEPVTVTAYFSQDLPPDIENLRRDFKDLLTEYSTLSKGGVVYEFINPNKDEKTENEAVQAGIFPLQINVREKDQLKMQKAFLGAVVQLGEEKEVIPVMQSSEGMEYALTTAIKKLVVVDKPLIGILQGHGEPALNQLQQVAAQLDILYQLEPVALNDSTYELSRFNTLAIVAPSDSIPPAQLDQLDRFLAEGGNLLVAINRVQAELSQQYGQPLTTGLEGWLSAKGINVNNNFVIDQNCGGITVQMQQGPFMINQQMQFPYFPIVTNFGDHPVTKGLEQVILQFASTINFSGDTSVSFVPIALTSSNAGTRAVAYLFDIQRQWQETTSIGRPNLSGCHRGQYSW